MCVYLCHTSVWVICMWVNLCVCHEVLVTEDNILFICLQGPGLRWLKRIRKAEWSWGFSLCLSDKEEPLTAQSGS